MKTSPDRNSALLPVARECVSLKHALVYGRGIRSAYSSAREDLMDALVTADVGLFSRALVIGTLGGFALFLGRRFSTRGAIMFPIYAGILAVASLVIAQFPGLSFAARFRFVMLAMLVATVMSIAEVMYATQLRLRRRAARGLPPVEGSAPWWSAPFVLATVAAVSASVAMLIR
jgi:hypothetical protein